MAKRVFEQATEMNAARWNCTIEPLEQQDHPWYEPLERLLGLYRGGNNILLRDLDPNQQRPFNFHMALAGPRGSGKSTLVLQSFDDCKRMGLFPVYTDVLKALDPGDIAYSDLLLTLVVAVDRALEEAGVSIDRHSLELVRAWFYERLLTEEHIKELDLKVETGAEGSGGIPFLGKLFAKVTAAFRGGSKYREQIRTRIDRSPNELVDQVNIYLDAATTALREKDSNFKEIMVFFDNLERISNASAQVDAALVQRAPLLSLVRCVVVYTVPFALLSTPQEGGLVGDAFPTLIVPMVALRGPSDSQDVLLSEPKKTLRRVLRRRMDLEKLMENEGLARELILASGGCPRDLLHATMLACEYAGQGIIDEAVVQKALARASAEHVRTVGRQDWARLARVHRCKQIDNEPDDYRMIYHRLILHYNDSGWYDAHPLVMRDPRFQAALAAES